MELDHAECGGVTSNPGTDMMADKVVDDRFRIDKGTAVLLLLE